MIRVLSDEVINRIAAGEVVERPLSVVKELVENSLDAGATRIAVAIKKGGKELIKVVDNGKGIAAEELPLAFSRHGTSKITDAADLETLETLGFRGEALPSIASISRLTITSRQEGADANVLKIEGGKIGEVAPIGAPFGTTIEVRDLFFNTPARAKFMKTDNTETLRVTRTLMELALANPHVSFLLTTDGKESFSTTGSGELREVVARLFTPRLAKNCLEVDYTEGWVTIKGLVGNPETAKGSRQQQFWALGQRPISAAMLSSALDRAYEGLLPRGKHPFVALSLELEPHLVDVNVHPAKREVRFREESQLYRTVVHAIRGAFADLSPKEIQLEKPQPQVEIRPHPEFNFPQQEEPQTPLWKETRQLPSTPLELPKDRPLKIEEPRLSYSPTPSEPKQPVDKEEVAATREPLARENAEGAQRAWPQKLEVLGQAENLYLVAAGEDGLYLVDQHAAHERIRYEELQRKSGKAASQLLLVPQRLELGAQEAKALEEGRAELEKMGFVWEGFGGGSILLRAIPATLEGDLGEVLADFAALLLSNEYKGATPWQKQARIYATMACHSSVRAGERLPKEAMEEIIEKLGRCEVPRTCPHGRPTMLKLPWDEVNRHFQR